MSAAGGRLAGRGGAATAAAPPSRRATPTAAPHRRSQRNLPLPPPQVGGFDGFLTLGSLLKPEMAALVSAAVALSSVGLNYYGSLATEQRRASLQAQLEEERNLRAQQAELQSIIGRYRGPLLESSVDLENRLWHMATKSGEWSSDPSALCFEEVTYTLFTLAQFLGFLEIVRREGPRERSFLQLGSPHGGDTLATLLEGVKFALCASPATLEAWLAEPGAQRDHPGARTRMLRSRRLGDDEDGGGRTESDRDGNGDPFSPLLPGLRISRGLQRAVGAVMTVTPMGAERHYTLSYSDFVERLRTDAQFAAWFRPIERDLAALLTGPSWRGQPPGAFNPWTRILLLQQLMIDTVDLLDPDYVRVGNSRRVRLSPVRYAPLPNVDVFRLQLSALSTGIDPIVTAALKQVVGGGTAGLDAPGGGVVGVGGVAGGVGGVGGGGVGVSGVSGVTAGGDAASRSLFFSWARGEGGAGAAATPGATPGQNQHFQALNNLQAEWDGSVSASSEEEDGNGGGSGSTSGRFVGGSPVLPPELLPEIGVSGVSLADLKKRRGVNAAGRNGGTAAAAVAALVGGNGASEAVGQQAQQAWSLLTPLGGLLGGITGGGGKGAEDGDE
jgi:hypothetical protein